MIRNVLRSGACLLLLTSGANAAEPRDNKAVADFVAAINSKDVTGLKALLADDFVMHKRDASCGAHRVTKCKCVWKRKHPAGGAGRRVLTKKQSANDRPTR